jgi:hypothetical protein
MALISCVNSSAFLLLPLSAWLMCSPTPAMAPADAPGPLRAHSCAAAPKARSAQGAAAKSEFRRCADIATPWPPLRARCGACLAGMKFGKRLLREQSNDWREHYICYKVCAFRTTNHGLEY